MTVKTIMKHSCRQVGTKENENQKEAVAGLQATLNLIQGTGLSDRTEVEAEARHLGIDDMSYCYRL